MSNRPLLTLFIAGIFSCGCAANAAPQSPATVTVPAPLESAAPEITGYHCEGTPFHTGNNDYCAYETPASWGEARRACEAMSGRLVTFDSEDEARAVVTALGPSIEISTEAFWFGLTESADEEGHWKWLDGSRATYTHWNKGEPNDTGSEEDCAEWKLGPGSWNDAPCWAYRNYICQQRGTTPLTCDGTRLNGSNGDFCFSSEKLDWDDAKKACADSGGMLAILSTKEKDESLYKAIGPKLGFSAVWIGYSDMAREGIWRWVSGSRYEFNAWKSGEPNDFLGDEDCAEWYPEDGLMNDLLCSTKRPYLCERLPN